MTASALPMSAERACAAVRVVGVGHVSLDHVFNLPVLPTAPVKTPASRHRDLVGGMTANACVAAARLGAAASIVAPVGDDMAADVFAAYFAREGVQSQGLRRVPGASSSVSAILVDAAGERLIVNHRGDALAKAPAFDPAWLDHADVLLTDPRCPAWAEAALRRARWLAIPSVFDGDVAERAALQHLAGLAGWAVFSEPGLAVFSDLGLDAALAQALSLGAGCAVVTLGEQGVAWRRPGQATCRMPAVAVAPVIDTLAAGDVFHGALAVALAEGQADAAAIGFAATSAALKCLRADGVLGAPSRAELTQWLAAGRGVAHLAGSVARPPSSA